MKCGPCTVALSICSIVCFCKKKKKKMLCKRGCTYVFVWNYVSLFGCAAISLRFHSIFVDNDFIFFESSHNTQLFFYKDF